MKNKTPRACGSPKTGIALVLLLLASWHVGAQAQPSVEAAFLDYAKATKSYDTQKMSALMHPEALRRFRTTFDAAFQGPKKEMAAKELLPLFSLTSAAQFAELSDLEAYKRLNDTIAKTAPQVVDMMAGATFTIVGSFLKDDAAYVTYNFGLTVNDKAITSEVVQKLKLHDGKWLLMLPATSESSIAAIESRFK
jgi:hypothetical protein